MGKYDKTNEFNKNNYVNVLFRINKELLPKYTEIAKNKGYKSVNSYAKALFEEAIHRDLTADPE